MFQENFLWRTDAFDLVLSMVISRVDFQIMNDTDVQMEQPSTARSITLHDFCLSTIFKVDVILHK